MAGIKSREIREYGDFQTPAPLALAACNLLLRLGITPRWILEPTCGRGSFVEAAVSTFPSASRIIGSDINPHHLDYARSRLSTHIAPGRVELLEGDFFKIDWNQILRRSSDPCLILGNPPWVTCSELGSIGSGNIPEKTNCMGRTGIEALTGKSNFDLSECMLYRYLEWLNDSGGHIAILVKTVVARKVLLYASMRGYPIRKAAIYKIDAMAHFNASVDACFFVMEIGSGNSTQECAIFEDLNDTAPTRTIGCKDKILVSDMGAFRRSCHLSEKDLHYIWRSGIKHDCAKVMELVGEDGHYVNGFGERVVVEEQFVYPLLKSSEVNNGTWGTRFLIVSQRAVGEDTEHIKDEAPRTWEYLQSYRALFDQRRSAIYRGRPPFSIFGVGEYSFAPWKVAISGFYKKLRFLTVGPIRNKPTVFDDTVYFLACYSEAEALFITELLSSGSAEDFYNSMIFWSDKRPITIDILKRLSLEKLAQSLGRFNEYKRYTEARKAV